MPRRQRRHRCSSGRPAGYRLPRTASCRWAVAAWLRPNTRPAAPAAGIGAADGSVSTAPGAFRRPCSGGLVCLGPRRPSGRGHPDRLAIRAVAPAPPGCNASSGWGSSVLEGQVEQAALVDQVHQRLNAITGLAIGEDEGLVLAHHAGVVVHHLKAGTDIGGQIGLVDDQDVGLGDARAVLARDLVAGSDIDHVDEKVDQGRAEGEGQVVAPGLDQHQIGFWKARLHVFDRSQIHRRVFTHRRMRAGAGLDADDFLFDQNALEGALDVFGILGGDHIVGDDQHLDAQIDQDGRDGFDDGGLAGADRASDANAGDSFHAGDWGWMGLEGGGAQGQAQFMNMRTLACSWWALKMSNRGAKLAISSSERLAISWCSGSTWALSSSNSPCVW